MCENMMNAGMYFKSKDGFWYVVSKLYDSDLDQVSLRALMVVCAWNLFQMFISM
jgi:hypothetical protein